jgi:hypothetical protein
MDESREKPGDLWSVITELTHLHEDEFRNSKILGDKQATLEDCLIRVLRPHDDAGFATGDQWMMQLRERLDKALVELTFREIRRELGLTNEPLPDDIAAELWALFCSEAFLRYVNAYLYFGIRFLPYTEDFKPYAEKSDVARTGNVELPGRFTECPEANRLVFPLKPPPELTDVPDVAVCFDEFLEIWNSDEEKADVAEALQFLDDFHVTPQKPEFYELEEPTAFELWLRGLRPEIEDPQKSRFERIRAGLQAWVLTRSNFYLALNPPPKTGVEMGGSAVQGKPHRPQERQVTDPIAARLALNDLYWIARLLRADVSSNGWVRYEKNNWLHLLHFNAVLNSTKDEATQAKAEASEKQDVEPGKREEQAKKRKEAAEKNKEEIEKIRHAEETLRSVFDFALDVVQNAIEVSSQPPDSDRPRTTWQWRGVFDEELDEIERERRVRHFRDPSLPPEDGGETRMLPEKNDRRKENTWSKKVSGKVRPNNLIGLAFSGGGIRSATLNLGILQGLQELDLLRHLDYVSTVSGGGFIGSWLVGNVRRSLHWLGRRTDWSESIRHLRDYSNYLAPRTGVLSADTWNLANSWLRNTFLIQVTGVAWLFVLLLTAIVSLRGFLYVGKTSWGPGSVAACLAWAASTLVVCAASYYLVNLSIYVTQKRGFVVSRVEKASGWLEKQAQTLRMRIKPFVVRHPGIGDWLNKNLEVAASVKDTLACGGWVLRSGVLPAWIGAWALASYLWYHAPLHACDWICLYGVTHYSELLGAAWRPWLPLMIAAAVGFGILAWNTLRWQKWFAFWISPVCTVVLYLEFAAIFYLFRKWSESGDPANTFSFVFGPALVLVAFGICILLMIGFTGRKTTEAQREWWTRFGTWLGIFGGVGVFICGAAAFGPWIVLKVLSPSDHPWLKGIQWATVVSWVGTVVGGLLAGSSSKTSGQGDTTNSPKLELLAKAGGLLFIIGTCLLWSTLLYVLLFEMFGPDHEVIGSDPRQIFCELNLLHLFEALGATIAIGWLFSWFFEINIFGLSQFYRNRLVRCYLGATRWMDGNRKPDQFTKFDFRDDLGIWRFRTDSPGEDLPREKELEVKEECTPYRGPFAIVSCSLNLAGSSELSLNTRHGASFTLTPLRCGCDRPRVGYAPTFDYEKKAGGFADGIQLGQAVAVSGAAVSPNMGYNTSPLVAFLLTMFNVRLGWWFPNPGQRKWKARGLNFSLPYLIQELFGMANDKSDYVNVTDGGHFENLAIYELIRRRCKLIIACDAECDEGLQFGGLGKMIRLCQTDFGALIDLDVKSLRSQASGHSLAHCAVGTIKYCTGEIGYLVYLKASMTGDEEVSVEQYRSSHPAFPHESTTNQFYSEDQFESYRMLGLHMVRKSFQGILPGDDPLMIAERMFDVLAPASPPSEKFVQHAKTLVGLWEKFRAAPQLLGFMHELITVEQRGALDTKPILDDELCIGLELIQLMENVFLDLRLDDFWEHPDNRGWAILFMRWARSPKFRRIWNGTRRTFGIRFEYFCSARLGLVRDIPIVRV